MSFETCSVHRGHVSCNARVCFYLDRYRHNTKREFIKILTRPFKGKFILLASHHTNHTGFYQKLHDIIFTIWKNKIFICLDKIGICSDDLGICSNELGMLL